jgi:hypothetical protein
VLLWAPPLRRPWETASPSLCPPLSLPDAGVDQLDGGESERNDKPTTFPLPGGSTSSSQIHQRRPSSLSPVVHLPPQHDPAIGSRQVASRVHLGPPHLCGRTTSGYGAGADHAGRRIDETLGGRPHRDGVG